MRSGLGPHDGISALMRRGRVELSLSTHIEQGMVIWEHSEKAAVCNPKREPPPATDPASWTSQYQDCEKINICVSAVWSVVLCYGSPTKLRQCQSAQVSDLPTWAPGSLGMEAKKVDSRELCSLSSIRQIREKDKGLLGKSRRLTEMNLFHLCLGVYRHFSDCTLLTV